MKVGRIEQLTHTPAPWEWDGKFTVTIPHREGETAFRTNREDARLIAAAPDLLAALKNLVSTHEGYKAGVGPCICAAHEAARAAIAKAEGR